MEVCKVGDASCESDQTVSCFKTGRFCVCTAIHRAAGPGLLEACKRYPKVLSERCPTGDAKVTL